MTTWEILILLFAGIIGGAMNAVAGGASLITFPAMMTVGLSPIVANASNTVATSVGTVTAALREWQRLPPFDMKFYVMALSTIVGGVLGGVLLLATDPQTFELLVPVLILAGTVLFALAPYIQKLFGAANVKNNTTLPLMLALTGVAIYGGYFGAGLGVLIMATICAFTYQDMKTNNALKNLLGPLANFAAIPVFVWNDVIEWTTTLIVLTGVVIGAQLGVLIFRKMPERLLRFAIITIGLIMSAIYTYRVIVWS